MRNSFLSHKIVIIFCISFASKVMYAQLGFCQGNSGDPIFTETFGSGLQDSSLPAGTTTYAYANGQAPNDGLYTVSSNSNYFDWFDINDHTLGDSNGRMLIINSDFNAGEFYKTTINGLCENTTYEFSSWLINLSPAGGFCGSGVIPINVSFEIWDNTDTNLLASGATGNIFSTTSPDWNQYALVFQSIPGQTSVILKMINNGTGGCGNDLAIDDIVFRSCGDSIIVEDGTTNNSVTLCSSETPYSDTLTAIPDNVVFDNHFYQWQSSTDGSNWADIFGETSASLNISGLTTTTYYRAKVTEYAANLGNPDCITFSDVFEIIVNQAPSPPTIECWETSTFDDATCSWIIIGTQPIQPTTECWEVAVFNNSTCAWEVTGIQPVQPVIECWETATFDNAICNWSVSGTQPMQPNIECWEIATFNNTTCLWDVTGTQPLAPTGLECWETTVFNDTTCSWDVMGSQPVQPNIECWETALFDTNTCSWSVTGLQPIVPTNLECWETATFNNVICDWEITGTQPLQPILECWETTSFNTATCQWDIFGTQPEAPTGLECWEIATFNDAVCSWEVTGTEPEEPTDLLCWQTAEFNEAICAWEILGDQPLVFRDEFLFLCQDETLTLEATSTISNPTYVWGSGEITPSIEVDSPGTYEVEVTDGCFTEIITFNVTEIANPVIESVVTNGSSIIVNLSTEGSYLYSLDGIDYQFSNVFSNTPTGLYTVYVKAIDCDVVVTQEHFHFFIQKFMTPNDDGNNDFFSLNIAQYFTSSEVYIFDRYGKLLFAAKNSNVNWDGTFNNSKLPTSDYWYRIVLDGQEFKGHFTLKR